MGRSLRETDLRQLYGVTVVAQRRGETLQPNPSGDARIEADDVLVLLGMPEEIRTRAMEPFVTSQPGGTGLGLAVVYTAVEEHGGTIDIQSVLGRGTTVTVELPEGRTSE